MIFHNRRTQNASRQEYSQNPTRGAMQGQPPPPKGPNLICYASHCLEQSYQKPTKSVLQWATAKQQIISHLDINRTWLMLTNCYYLLYTSSACLRNWVRLSYISNDRSNLSKTGFWLQLVSDLSAAGFQQVGNLVENQVLSRFPTCWIRWNLAITERMSIVECYWKANFISS